MTLEKITILLLSVVTLYNSWALARLTKWVDRFADDVFRLASQTDWRLKKVERSEK